jgi:hypothetical protein
MIIVRPLPGTGIVHVRFGSQEELTRAFVRMQEFYESPYPTIKGHYFRLSTFEMLYAADHGDMLTSYYQFWEGFNIPGEIVQRFAKVFAEDMTMMERELVGIRDMRYLIGTYQDEDVSHEITHALFHLDPHYKEDAMFLVKQFMRVEPKLAMTFTDWLANRGYDSEVFIDEVNAWFSTNDLNEFRKYFDPATAAALYDLARPFRELLTKRVADASSRA